MAIQKQKHPVKEHGFRNLLFFLLLYIVGSPFLVPYPSLAVLAHLSLSVALFAAVYAVSREKNQRSVAISLLLPLLLLYWLGIYDIISFSRVGAYLLFTVYYGLLVYLFVSQIRNAKRVSANVLYATFSLYLIIGLFWGSLYALVYQFSPGAYSGVLLENTQNVNHTFNYFSFVTLTTLGYGDITPQIPGAASLCQMEAIVGQFFTAVVVAWLMGMYLFDSKNQKQDQ
jgi:voltage-gated potassium channel